MINKKAIGRGLSALLMMMVLILVIINYRRGYTPTIKDEYGRVLPNSITELTGVSIGGMEQWLQIRGNNVDNPVLLWLHGGPGAAQIPIGNYFNGDLEEEFIVVHWDQRGAGKSNPFGFNEETMTLQQFEEDAHQVTQYLKSKLNKDKVYLVGHSWGAQLGIRVANKYPEDYYAYIGVSQVIDGNNGSLAYEWLREEVKDKGNNRDIKKLNNIGEPPYLNHDNYVAFANMISAYGGGMDIGMGKLAAISLRAPEYKLVDYIKWLRGASRGSGPMWGSTRSPLIEDVGKMDIPTYFISGKKDYNTPLALVEEYFNQLEAPMGKELIVFEKSAHGPFMAEGDKFYKVMVKIREETLNNKEEL